jgi:hypothetical protein
MQPADSALLESIKPGADRIVLTWSQKPTLGDINQGHAVRHLQDGRRTLTQVWLGRPVPHLFQLDPLLVCQDNRSPLTPHTHPY